MVIRRKAATALKRARYALRYSSIPTLPQTTKKHLVIITGELEVGGVGRVLLNIIQPLPTDEFNITIITTDPRLNGWAPEFNKYADRIVDIPLIIGRSLSQDFVERYLQRYLSKNRADVIFITNSTAAYKSLPHIQQKGQSKSAAIYDLMHTHGRPEDDDAFLKISMPYDEHITKRVVISHYLRDYFCEHYPVNSEKVVVIYNGIDKPALEHTPDTEFGKKFLGMGTDEHAITYLGRLQSDKSPIRLVEVAHNLKDDLAAKNMFFAVVGEGELETSLKQRAEALGIYGKQIRFFPFTDRPLDVSSASDFTILTSDLEGIPMSTLESMLMNTPGIAPAVGGIPEIIDDTKNGFLAPFISTNEEKRVKALAIATKKAIELTPGERTALGKSAHQKVLDKFCSMDTDYLALFRSA